MMNLREKSFDLKFDISAKPAPVQDQKIPGQEITEQRAKPLLKNMDYLVLEPRLRYAADAIRALNNINACVLDVGGRIQPYRHLFEGQIDRYIGLDPADEAMCDVVGNGEHLPFADEQFDMVICTQVLSYVTEPQKVVHEIHRVLKKGGTVILSAPSLCPMHDGERWRFLRQDLEVLFEDFTDIDIKPEGHSIAGLCRTMNIGFEKRVSGYYTRRLLEQLIFVPINYLGSKLDKLSRGSERFTANFFVVATR